MAETVEIIRSPEGPWMEIDKEWFSSHPGQDWFVREPCPGELAFLRLDEKNSKTSLMLSRFDKLKEEGGGEIKICVFQVREGVRSRAPILERSDGEKFLFSLFGDYCDPEKFLGELRGIHAGNPDVSDYATEHGDACYVCKRSSSTGEVCLHFVSDPRGASCCLICGMKRVAKGEQTQIFSIYVSKRDCGTTEQMDAAIKKSVKEARRFLNHLSYSRSREGLSKFLKTIIKKS